MCGIFSYFSTEKGYTSKMSGMLHHLMSATTIRGKDSTGMFYGDDDNVEYMKKAVSGHDFSQMKSISSVLDDFNKYKFIVGHNRAATLGKVISDNAHPFQHDNIVGVHNGTLKSHYDLCEDVFDTDSEHIFKALSETEDTSTVVQELDGAFALIWHDKSDNTLHMVRNSQRPYCLAKLKGLDTIVGCSERKMLEWILHRNGYTAEYFVEPKEMKEYIFDVSTMKVLDTKAHVEYVSPGKWNTNYSSNVSNSPNTERTFWTTSFTPTNDISKVGVWHGQCADETKIIKIHGLMENELELGQYYTGIESYSGKDYIVIMPKGIKIVYEDVVEEEEDEGEDKVVTPNKIICDSCGESFNEELIHTIQESNVCTTCAITFDLIEGDKANVH